MLDTLSLETVVSNFSLLTLLALVVGLVIILAKGADWAIEGAVNLAYTTNMSRVVVGATIVSLGTTLPEVFVSVVAAINGNPGLSLGNGVGSIIVDTGFILGLICFLSRVPLERFILNRTGWIQVGSATLLVLISLFIRIFSPSHPVLGRWVGVLFLSLLGLYLYFTLSWARHLSRGREKEREEIDYAPLVSIILIGWGLILVVFSSKFLIVVAQELARRLGVSEDVIASTMVAFGTSLPELATAITAVKKGHPEIMVGNVVGADVLNCLFVIGASALASPLKIPSSFFYLHYPAMLLILYSFRLFISTNKGEYFPRWQGLWLISLYLFYVFWQYC